MCKNNWKEYCKGVNKKGFSLIELIVFMTIISIISAIVIPAYLYNIEQAKVKVCTLNRQQLLNMYHTYLIINDQQDSEMLFDNYVKEYGQTCPENGIISMIGDSVQCSIHYNDERIEEDNEDDTIPYL